MFSDLCQRSVRTLDRVNKLKVLNDSTANWLKGLFNRFLDILAKWVIHAVNFIVVISGGALSYDFSKFAESHPSWSGPINLVADYSFIVFVFSSFFALIIGFLGAYRMKTINDLQKSIDNRDRQLSEIGNAINILFDGLLVNFSIKIGLKQSSKVRVTLYIFDSVSKSFIPCGRYTKVPTYNSPGRTSYPADQGCISKGWLNSWHFDNRIPSSEQRRRKYNLNNYRIPEDVTDQMRMKSTFYAVKRLDNVDGAGEAVLVVESTVNNEFDEAEIRAKMEEVEQDYARMVRELRSYVPNAANATNAGL